MKQLKARKQFTIYVRPSLKKKCRALAKRYGCSMNFILQEMLALANRHFDTHITELIRIDVSRSRRKREHKVPVTVRLSPETYEDCLRIVNKEQAAIRGRIRRTRRFLLCGKS